MKSIRLSLAVIFFMTYFYGGGAWPPGSATVRIAEFIGWMTERTLHTTNGHNPKHKWEKNHLHSRWLQYVKRLFLDLRRIVP